MLLHSTSRQQPWGTSTILRHQRHRLSLEILEGKTSSQTDSSSSTMASGYRLDTKPSTTSYCPRSRDQAVQHYTSTSLYRHCIHQIPLSHGQPLQSQRSSNQMGRWRNTSMRMLRTTTILTPTSTRRPTSRSGWRYITLHQPTLYIDCHGLPAEQDFPTVQGNICLSDRLSPLGLPGIPSHHYHVHILMIFGPDLCNLTEPQSRSISLIRTSFASNNSSQMQSSTMKINVLHPF